MKDVDSFELSVLRQIEKNPLATDQVGSFQSFTRLKVAFAGIGDNFIRLKAALRSLRANNYLRLVDENLANGETDIYERYQLTPLGEEALNHSAQITNISHNRNSTIASQSQNIVQTINISEYDDDIKGKIAELQKAITEKDKVTVKKAIGYILDKSLDLGIQIIESSVGKVR